MGLFSSIGSFLGGDLLGSVGGIVDDAFGMSSSNKANSQKQANYNQQMQLALRQQQFNEDYVKNALQWRVDDAQKAGLHPMAVLGLSSPSAGGVSSLPSIDTYNPIDMGQSTNYAATKAKDRQQQAKMVELQMRGLALDNEYKQAQIDALKADTLASSITSNQALRSPSAPSVNATSPVNTGLRSPEGSAYHVWDMGDGNFDILMNPDYQQTIGDEFGQVATTLKAITRAKQGVWINPEDGRSYVYNPHTGYFNLLSALSDEEASRLLGNRPVSVGSGGSHYERNRYRYRY